MKAELKRAFSSVGFWITILLMFLCLQGFALPVHISQTYGLYAEPVEYRQSALSLTLGGIFFGGVILLLPFCATFAYAGSQVEDIRSGFLPWCGLRSSVRTYALRKIIASFASASTAIFIAFIVHAGLWHLLGIPYDPTIYPYQEIPFAAESYFSSWASVANGWPIILNIALGMAFSAGCWAIVALSITVWIPDNLLICIIPACIEKLWRSNLSYYLLGIWLPSPDTLFNDAQTVTGNIQCITAYIVVLTMAVLLYMIGLSRRMKHA